MPGVWKVEGSGLAGDPPLIMGYFISDSGTAWTQASFGSISLSAYTKSGDTLTLVSGPTALTVSAVVFDTPQTDLNWDLNRYATGYNFRHRPAYAAPTVGTLYVYRVTFTPLSGAALKIDGDYRTDPRTT